MNNSSINLVFIKCGCGNTAINSDGICDECKEKALRNAKRCCYCPMCDDEMKIIIIKIHNGILFLYYLCPACGAVVMDNRELQKLKIENNPDFLLRIFNKVLLGKDEIARLKRMEEACGGDI